MLIRSYKYRLYPNRAQEAALASNDVRQAGELKAVRDAVPELAGYSYSAEQQVLRRLEPECS